LFPIPNSSTNSSTDRKKSLQIIKPQGLTESESGKKMSLDALERVIKPHQGFEIEIKISEDCVLNTNRVGIKIFF